MTSGSFPTSTGSLRFPSNFIDQETATCDEDFEATSRRSSDAPRFAALSHEFDTEDFFLAQEEARVSDFSDFDGGLVTRPCPTAEFLAAVAVMESNANISDVLLRAKDLSGQHRQADDDGTAASVCVTLSGVAASDIGVIPSSADSGACNLGSIGHPELCSRPCIYDTGGRCANGPECEFCHMPHSHKRSVHLPKKHRVSLERMTTEAAVAIMWPILQEKVLAFDSSPETIETLGTLEASLPVLAANELLLGEDRAEGSLARVLSGCSLRRVLLTLESITKSLPLIGAASEALLVRLRSVVLARV